MNGLKLSRLALGLDRAVVVALLEGEAADQRADRPVLRVKGDQRALCGGNLYEAQGAVFLALHADLVAGLGHVGGLARHRAHAVVAEEGACPFHAVPGHGFFLAVAGHHHDPALFHLGDDRRLQAADAALLAQVLEPGVAGLARQAGLRAAVAVALVIVDEAVADRLAGGVLQVAADRGDDLVALGIGLAAVAADHLGTGHLGDVGRIQFGGLHVVGGVDRLLDGGLVALLVDEAELEHALEDPVAPLRTAGRVDQRVVARGRFRQAGDHRHLGQAQVFDRLAVIDLCGSLDAIGTVAQVDLVDVELEDLVLGQLSLDLQGQEDFIDLSREASFIGKEVVLRYLHGDGAAASLDVTAFQ